MIYKRKPLVLNRNGKLGKIMNANLTIVQMSLLIPSLLAVRTRLLSLAKPLILRENPKEL